MRLQRAGKWSWLAAGLVMLTGGMAAAGCGTASDLQVSLTPLSVYQTEQAVPIHIEIAEGSKPVTGLKIKAVLEMKQMEHDTLDVQLQDMGNGIYEGKVKLPMAGQWEADVQIDDGRQKIEKIVDFKVQEKQKP